MYNDEPMQDFGPKCGGGGMGGCYAMGVYPVLYGTCYCALLLKTGSPF